MNKDLRKQLFLSLPAILFLLGVVWFLVWRLGTVSGEILSLKGEILKNRQFFENFSNLKIQKKQIESIQEKISVILPAKDSVLSLTSKLEQTASGLGLKQSFVFGAENNPSVAGVSNINFSLVLSGRLDGFAKYLEQLGSLPQFVEISSMEILKSDKDYQLSGAGRIYKK